MSTLGVMNIFDIYGSRPQGLKPLFLLGRSGTAKAVPSHTTYRRLCLDASYKRMLAATPALRDSTLGE